jgi:hypothetical protein
MGRMIFVMHWGVVKFSRYGPTLLTSDRPSLSPDGLLTGRLTQHTDRHGRDI